MNLSRRLFFRRAAGAAAAGPLALEAVASQVGTMGLSHGALGAGTMLGEAPGVGPRDLSELHWARETLARFLKEAKIEPRPEYVTRLDPDLTANRSMSLATRIRIQAERDAVRNYNREHQGLLDRIARLTKI
jgi:hypothetical protein